MRYGIQGDAVEDRTVETIRDSAGNVYNITGLASNTEYVVEVAAVNSAGTGVYSGAIYQLTLSMQYLQWLKSSVTACCFLSIQLKLPSSL